MRDCTPPASRLLSRGFVLTLYGFLKIWPYYGHGVCNTLNWLFLIICTELIVCVIASRPRLERSREALCHGTAQGNRYRSLGHFLQTVQPRGCDHNLRGTRRQGGRTSKSVSTLSRPYSYILFQSNATPQCVCVCLCVEAVSSLAKVVTAGWKPYCTGAMSEVTTIAQVG